MEIEQNLQINLVFCLSTGFCTYLRRYVFDLLPTLGQNRYIFFHVKTQLLGTYKSDQDPDPDLDPDTHGFGHLDPDPH